MSKMKNGKMELIFWVHKLTDMTSEELEKYRFYSLN